MKDDKRVRQMFGTSTVLKKSSADKRFASVVARARAANALNSANSLMASTQGKDTPAALRDRMNGHFFISGILYETLRLIRKMTRVVAMQASTNIV